MSSRFCEQCGAAISADDKFCGTCGNPVDQGGDAPDPSDAVPAFLTPASSVPNPAVPEPASAPAWGQTPQNPGPSTQSAPPSSMTSQPGAIGSGPNLGLLIGGLVIVLLILGGGSWYGWTLYSKSLGKVPAAVKGGAAATGAPQGSPSKTGQAPTSESQDGDRFLGLWAPEKLDDPSQSQEIMITRQGSLLVGINQREKTGHIELNVGPGSKLEGFYKEDGNADIPVTAEILSDGKRLVLTLAPPQSEFETVILLRVNEAEKAAALSGQAGGSPEVPGIVPISGVDEAYAQKVISQKKEVKEFIDLLTQKGKSPHFDIEPEDANTWMVRVYELVEDGDGMSHTATFGWYKVDRTTAAISPGM